MFYVYYFSPFSPTKLFKNTVVGLGLCSILYQSLITQTIGTLSPYKDGISAIWKRDKDAKRHM